MPAKRLILPALFWGAYSGVLLRLLELGVYLRSSKALLLDHAIGAAGEIVASVAIYVVLSASGGAGALRMT